MYTATDSRIFWQYVQNGSEKGKGQLQVISKFITCLVKLYINFEGKGNYVKSVKMLKMVAAPPMGGKIWI